MPRPTASGGTRMCRVVRARISSSKMIQPPIKPPVRIRLQSMSPAITPCASEEISPARGADETVSMIHEIEHRRNHKRARDYTDHERHLLLPRRCIDQLTGLEILQIIVGDGGNVEDHRGGKKRERH